MKIKVEAQDLYEVLNAFQGPPHVIREMIALASSALVDNPIRRLTEQYNSELEALNTRPGFIKPDDAQHVFFYEQDFYVLSNFSSFSLTWQGLLFPTSEHAYQWSKFQGGGEKAQQVATSIWLAKSAHEAFKLAGLYQDLVVPDWTARRVEIMRAILVAKIEQHEYVKTKLLATGDRTLIEDSWRDSFWGWGPEQNGENILGKLWMEIRASLREQGEV